MRTPFQTTYRYSFSVSCVTTTVFRRYSRYRPERRDQVAEFALQHGVAEACKHFQDDFGAPIIGSTVR